MFCFEFYRAGGRLSNGGWDMGNRIKNPLPRSGEGRVRDIDVREQFARR
jgi:hypothetical protein